MGKRAFLPIKENNLNDYIEIYLNCYPQGKDLSKEGVLGYYEKQLNVLKNYEDIKLFGAFEDNQLVATMKIIQFNINLFGEIKKSYGIMALGVHPLHRRKGIAREMLDFFHQYILEHDGSLALLLPFRIDFYRNLGYGLGNKLNSYYIPTRNLLMESIVGEKQLQFKLLDYNHRESIIKLYNKIAESTHGAIKKFSEEVRDTIADEEQRYIGCFRDTQLVGYAKYFHLPVNSCNYSLNTMVVPQIVYEDGKVLQGLLKAIGLQSDLSENLIIYSHEEDFHQIIGSPQNINGGYVDFGFMETSNQYIGTMYKILDFHKFIKDNCHRKFMAINMLLKFSVVDDLTKEEEELLIKFQEHPSKEFSYWDTVLTNECSSKEDAKIKIKKSDLSSLLMGSLGLGGLYRLGAIDFETSLKDNLEEVLEKLDRLFYISKKPFTNTDY